MNTILNLIILFYVVDTVLCLGCSTTTCATNQILDCVKCQCIPRLNCASQPPDMPNCDVVDCSSLNATLCPNKCYCQNPSVLNNYCPSCLNGGMRNFTSNTCQCICPFGYIGDRCQFTPNPCQIDDTPDCANVDCYNTNEAMFFQCQRKCLCCANERCYNLGLFITVNTTQFTDVCSCNCVNSNYSPYDNCQTPLNCMDDKYCAIQFGVYPSNQKNCNFPFIKALCPLSCGICTKISS